MRKVFILSAFILFLFTLFASVLPAGEETVARLDERIQNCIALLDEVMQMPDKGIPQDLLAECSGIAIFPAVLKGGFIIGGRYGKGVVVYHNPHTGKWSAPAFYTTKGLSFGVADWWSGDRFNSGNHHRQGNEILLNDLKHDIFILH